MVNRKKLRFNLSKRVKIKNFQFYINFIILLGLLIILILKYIFLPKKKLILHNFNFNLYSFGVNKYIIIIKKDGLK